MLQSTIESIRDAIVDAINWLDENRWIVNSIIAVFVFVIFCSLYVLVADAHGWPVTGEDLRDLHIF